MTKGALKRLLSLMLCCVLSIIFAGCTTIAENEQNTDPGLRVAATIFPLADIAGCIGGERAEVTTLLPAGANPHTFELTPKQAKKLADIDIFIKVGAGVDDWVDDFVSIAQGNPSVITVTSGVELKRNGDPHIWLDPVIVKEHIAPIIGKKMCVVRPELEEYFAANQEVYVNELDLLHKDIQSSMDAIQNKKIISFHSCWGYFCERYGIDVVATIEESHGKEPSAARIANVVEEAKKNRVRAVFAEPQFNPKAAEIIADEFGGKLVFPDPIGGEGVQDKDSYIKLMIYNTETFAKTFNPGQESNKDG